MACGRPRPLSPGASPGDHVAGTRPRRGGAPRLRARAPARRLPAVVPDQTSYQLPATSYQLLLTRGEPPVLPVASFLPRRHRAVDGWRVDGSARAAIGMFRESRLSEVFSA